MKLVAAGHADVADTPGVPASLAEMLWYWFEAPITPVEEIVEAVTAERGMTCAVAACVRALLDDDVACTKAIRDRIVELEGAGRRIVDGGPTSHGKWEITDWRTGEVIAAGTGGADGYDQAVARLDPRQMMFHAYHLSGPVYDAFDKLLPQVSGVPESLADALRAWCGSLTITDAELAEVCGLSTSEVPRSTAGRRP